MRTYFFAAILFTFSALFSANAQQQSPTSTNATTPAPVEAKLEVDKGKDSTIVFFREQHFAGSALKPSIYLDSNELDRLANGRWFAVHVVPGKHELQSSAKHEPATVVETKAGETTYIQMIVVTGNWRGAGRLLQVDSGDAQKAITKLKPLHE